jgi:NADH dehydrogenase FAD-containing subunit
MAGQIAEMARRTLRREFRAIDPREARILLIEASNRVLGTFPPRLSASAQRALERLGASVLLGRRVLAVDKASPLDGIVEMARPDQFRLDELVHKALTARNDPRDVTTDPHATSLGIVPSVRGA